MTSVVFPIISVIPNIAKLPKHTISLTFFDGCRLCNWNVVATREKFVLGRMRIIEIHGRIQGDTNQLLELVRLIERHPYSTKRFDTRLLRDIHTHFLEFHLHQSRSS